MNIAENLLRNCKYNEKLADYEAFADYLNTHKGEVTDISGVNIIKLLSTKAAKRQLSQHAENYEEVLVITSLTEEQQATAEDIAAADAQETGAAFAPGQDFRQKADKAAPQARLVIPIPI